ncbi:DUF2092 domain-containing protein [Paraburkholderia bryophila]|uniref:DUF2092 domain-containing protein n=1 Tax=Burkholderiaceae TaxID=119060 RepID=UPI00054DD617|nr:MULTISPECIES: DUF2092 domain-containing protein [Burkholderiaceae]
MAPSARLLCLLVVPLTTSVWAADATNAPEPADSAAVVNPQVVDKVVQMGDYLRSLPDFQVNAAVERDVVLDNGQKIKTLGTTEMVVQGRSHLYARAETDTQSREYFYNGKQLTQYSPSLKYYTTVNAPPKILDALHQFEDYYGLQLPMEDLFLFGSDQSQIDALKSAAYVGPSKVDGKVCDHLAFRQDGADWQLWVSRSDKPLPCKLVITTTDDDSKPEYSAVYRWNLTPAIKESSFTFAPGKGDTSIPFKKVKE